MVVKEPIVTVDDEGRRLVWGADAPNLKHYSAAVQVFGEGTGARVTWIADFLPDEAANTVGPMMEQGMAAMKIALDALAAGSDP
jgi:hypothetical protein